MGELRRQHEAKAENAKVLLATWKDELKEAIKNHKSPPPKPPGADEVDTFVIPRLYTQNVTIERLGVLLKARLQPECFSSLTSLSACSPTWAAIAGGQR